MVHKKDYLDDTKSVKYKSQYLLMLIIDYYIRQKTFFCTIYTLYKEFK